MTQTNSEQSPVYNQTNNILQIMTSVLKFYKYILNQLQCHYRHQNQTLSLTQNQNKLQKLQQAIINLIKASNAIQQYNLNKMLGNRFMNRLIETTTLYKSKYMTNQYNFQLKQQIHIIFQLMKEYQSGYHGLNAYTGMENTISSNPNINRKFQFSMLFQKICWIFKKSIKQLKQYYNKLNGTPQSFPTNCSKNLITHSNNNSHSTILHSTSQNRQRDKDKQKDKQRRNSIGETPVVKSLQYKYKLTKQVIGNISLLVGMDVQTTHLRGLFFQARNNVNDVYDDRMDQNQGVIKARHQYFQKYLQWRQKVKARRLKKQKSIQSSPNKMKNSQNRMSPSKYMRNMTPMSCTTSKMPKLLQPTSFSNHPSTQQTKKRTNFVQMQALTFNRQFIHLSQIKNQKIAKRPYAEVKQVLVTGDELNYYSNKNAVIQYALGGYGKASFFMQRAMKNQKVVTKKKINIGNGLNQRLLTQEQ